MRRTIFLFSLLFTLQISARKANRNPIEHLFIAHLSRSTGRQTQLQG